MPHFIKDSDGNIDYYYDYVHGTILADYANPEGIEAYLEDEVFFETVKNRYKNIDLSGTNKKDIARYNARVEKTANWLRKQVQENRFEL